MGYEELIIGILIGALVGIVTGIATHILLEKVKIPEIKFIKSYCKISQVRERDRVDSELPNGGIMDDGGKKILIRCLRIQIECKKGRFIVSPAYACEAWIHFDGDIEVFQIPWLGNGSTVTINSGGVRAIDFGAVVMDDGEILFPNETGYGYSIGDCRHLAIPTSKLTGTLRVTSQNTLPLEIPFEFSSNKTSDGIYQPEFTQKQN